MRKNIFAIARRGSHDDEDQLTELLAYLFQEEPVVATNWLASLGFRSEWWRWSTQSMVEGGRLDLELENDDALIIVESKLGSSTNYAQCSKYINHARAVGMNRSKVLVLLTKYEESWPVGIPELAGNVELVRQRWWDLAGFLYSQESRLAHDLADMLRAERMTVPPPISSSLRGWDEIAPSVRHLLEEARPQLAKLSPGYRSQRITGVDQPYYRSIHSFIYFERAQMRLGVAASKEDMERHCYFKATGPEGCTAVISSSVRNPTVPLHLQSEAAASAMSGGGAGVVGVGWGTWPTRATCVSDVLTAGGFQEQVTQAVEYARATADHFRSVGYLDDMSE